MVTASDYRKIKDIEHISEELGFKLKPSQYADTMALYPTEKLAIYYTDSPLVNGSIDDLYCFLLGWKKFKEYSEILGICSDEKIDRAIKNYQNKKLLKIIKDSEKNE